MKTQRTIAAAFALLISTSAFAKDQFDSKDVGALLDLVSATDTNGTQIARYLQKMAQLGDKWNKIDQNFGSLKSDGTYEDHYEIVNDGCGLSGHPIPCKIATLRVKVTGKIGVTPSYEVQYEEATKR